MGYNKLIYLATPYTHKDEKVMWHRERAVTIFAGYLTLKGIANYSPITQEFAVRQFVEMPYKWDFWREIDLTFIDHCDEVYVLCLEGFEESVGVNAEVSYAIDSHKPVKYVEAKVDSRGVILHRLRNFWEEVTEIDARMFYERHREGRMLSLAIELFNNDEGKAREWFISLYFLLFLL